MSCVKTSQLLKAFLDDLLIEEDYQNFVSHLDECSACRRYVREVGSLSNQLWELGDIKVPSDLAATILFGLRQPQKADKALSSPNLRKRSLKVFFFIGVLLLIAGGGFFLLWNLLDSSRRDDPYVEVHMIPAFKDANSFSKQATETVAIEERTPEAIDQKMESSGQFASANHPDKEPRLKAVSQDIVADVVQEPLHWHYVYANQTALDDAIINKQQLALKVAQKNQDVMRLESEIDELYIEIAKITNQLSSFITAETAHLQEELAALGTTLSERQGVLQEYENELDSFEASLEVSVALLTQIKRDEAVWQRGFMQQLRLLGASIIRHTDDLIEFSATGEVIEKLLEKIFLNSKDTSSVRFYHPRRLITPFEEHQVSVYFEKKSSLLRHWHFSCSPEEKQRLIEAMHEKNARINRESYGIIEFSISPGSIKNLKARVRAMNIDFSEFDYAQPQTKILRSAPVAIWAFIKTR